MHCAYCDRPTPATREHVWPSCFLDRFGRDAARFSVRAKKVHGADYVVADVCADCNGGSLSAADAYFCELYDRYFHRLEDFGAKVAFEYQYELLLRALLKISYNAARMGGSNAMPFLPFRPTMRGTEKPPANVAVFLELVSPSILPGPTKGSTKKVLPNVYRAAITEFTKPGGDRILSRFVAVNSYYFHLLLPLADLAVRDFEGIATDFGETINGVRRLSEREPTVEVATSPQDGLRSMLPHLTGYRTQYESYFARRRGK